MNKIERFEDIIAWQKARALTKEIYVALDQNYIAQDAFDQLYAKSDEVSRLVAGFMGYLQNSRVGGHKFKGRH